MRKLWIFMVLLLSFSITALAAPMPTEAPQGIEKQKNLSPISVERKNVDGKEYLIKVYETADMTDPEVLKEQDFEMDGFIFTHLTTDKKVNEKKLTKEVTEEARVETASKGLEEVLKQLPTTKEYNQDGYMGTMSLDTGSISTEVAGYTNKSYTVSTVKEYPGLMYADPSFVSQTAVKDGATLPLTNVDWVVMGTGLAGDSLVPTEYKATATYSKSFTNKVPTGYVSTARYKGIVAKAELGTVTYTLTYLGTVIEKGGMTKPLKIITGVIVVFLIAGGTALLIFYLKSRKGVEVYNLIEKEYICIGHQTIDAKKPVIDLNEFEELIRSNLFQFVLDKKTTKALFGKNVAVTLKDVTVKHMVRGRNEEYRFDMDLGGVLDAE